MASWKKNPRYEGLTYKEALKKDLTDWRLIPILIFGLLISGCLFSALEPTGRFLQETAEEAEQYRRERGLD